MGASSCTRVNTEGTSAHNTGWGCLRHKALQYPLGKERKGKFNDKLIIRLALKALYLPVLKAKTTPVPCGFID